MSKTLECSEHPTLDLQKEALGRHVADRIEDGQLLGIGTGSTVKVALAAIKERVRRERLRITALTTSYESSLACREIGIQTFEAVGTTLRPDWGFDGADEVDPHGSMIKGKGGALLREKILAERCREFFVLVDQSKIVPALGVKTPVPIECIPEALELVQERLVQLGATEIVLRDGRPGSYGPVITEKGHLILDTRFGAVTPEVAREIKGITGVVEHGLFMTHATEVWAGNDDGSIEIVFARR